MSDRPHTPAEAADCLLYGAEPYRKLKSWLEWLETYAKRGDQPYDGMLEDIQALRDALDRFAIVAEAVACGLSNEKPEKEDTLCGFVFLNGVEAEKERADWRKRVRRLHGVWR